MRYLFIYLKGMLMGAADLVPGVSGGTVALITGIYRELLESINAVSWSTLKLFQKEGFSAVWKKLNGSFLLAVFGGIVTSILIFSRLLEWLILNEPVGLWSFFFGLLVASIVYLAKTELKVTLRTLLYLLLGTLMSFTITQLNGGQNEMSLWYLFLSGFIGISAMILPGLSGAYILFIMGVYQTILSNVRQAQDLIFSFDMDQFIEIATVLGVFILGILSGLKVFAKFLTWLLNKHPQQIMAILIGLMIGALHKVWPWQNEILSKTSVKIEKTVAVLPSEFQGDSPQTLKAVIIMIFGFGILFLMERSKNLIKNER
jgi:putative membrane protein